VRSIHLRGIPHAVNTVILTLEVPMPNENILNTWYNKVTTWYRSKPWYMRLLCIGVIVVIVFLFLLRFIAGVLPEKEIVDPPLITPPKDPTASNDADEADNKKKILEVKRHLEEQLEETKQRQAAYAQSALDIANAKTMEELDAIREKLGL
jgi:hypothetical protein